MEGGDGRWKEWVEGDRGGVREMFTLALSGRGASRLGDGQADPWRCPWGRSLPHFIEAKRERKREAKDPGGLRLAARLRMPTFGARQPVSDPSLSLPLTSCVTSGHK